MAGISAAVSQTALAPVFGSLEVDMNHQEFLIASVVAGFGLRHFVENIPPGLVGKAAVTYAFWIPPVQFYLSRLSGVLGPQVGPIVVSLFTSHILLVLVVYACAEAVEQLQLAARYGAWYGFIAPAIFGLWHINTVTAWTRSSLPGLAYVSSFFVPVTLQLILACIMAFFVPSKLGLMGALPGLLHTIYFNPHLETEVALNQLNSTLHSHNWSLLDRSWSNTGYLSVLENLDTNYRVLRCDHSLLGGKWLLTPQRRELEGWTVDEPVYPVFEMLEAVRLLDLQPSVPDSQASALVIGLGTGTAPGALLAHGINTTVVEVDPIIHQYAVKHFGLPPTYISYVADAMEWVGSAAENKTTKYDYIIHDVFTGGAEPLNLFTNVFLYNLRSLLQPAGAIALNYAGDPKLPLTTSVLNTIDKTFDGQCKIYREPPAEEAFGRKAGGDFDEFHAVRDEDFINMVIFCRNSPGPVTFRQPAPTDFLGSRSREAHLLPRANLEIPFPLQHSSNRSAVLEYQILRPGDEMKYYTQQAQSAIRHWHIMRQVLPAAIWELW
ncbi:S-adenosyl-L-methionine-dependent methyltransferase [Neohortaea acidophila]|uniref:S-adenosyl-L-methionine-dependent methyltransferase n=1 Tax=Neohortaea acidophila TaxID=245834 RepID=A0A6A6PT23_9PEZI|nr:S-adenosyl-L-methionine-dependent methyltransferase [Neohortaea acidophila]KAF2482834.1 S-adenosyl-L-methionine-dependent methyltransferase [Neohortaea acidophila]